MLRDFRTVGFVAGRAGLSVAFRSAKVSRDHIDHVLLNFGEQKRGYAERKSTLMRI
jgi:hypothetical protein